MKKLFGFIVFLFFSLATSAQQSYFKQYSTQQGLPQSQIRSMIEDSRGNIWLATTGGGLAKLNGEEFTTLTQKDGLLRNDICQLLEDSEQNLWISYLRGRVSKYDGNKFTHFTDQDGLFEKNDTYVYSIVEDRHKNIWLLLVDFSTGKRILFLQEGDTFINYSKKDSLGLSNDLVASPLVLDKDKNLVVNTNQGAGIFNGKDFELKNTTIPEDLANLRFVFIHQDKRGIEWFLGINSQNRVTGFYQYDQGNLKPFVFPDFIVLAENFYVKIIEDKEGIYWFMIRNVGIVKFDPRKEKDKFTLYDEGNGFPASLNTLKNILSDREGNIWISTWGSGIIKFLDGDFINFFEEDGLPEQLVSKLYQDSEKNIWIGTLTNGVCKYDGKQIQNFPITEGIVNDFVISSFLEEDKNTILIGSRSSLKRLNTQKNTYKVVNKEFFLPENTGITSILKVKDKIWFATFRAGLFCYDTNTKKIIKKLTVDNGLTSNSIEDLAVDSKGVLWIATRNGLNKFDGQKISTFKNIPILSNGYIVAVCIDKNDNIWAIDKTTGLNYFDGKVRRTYDETDGLAASLVYSLSSDKEGDIWVGTQQGLSELTIDKNSQIIKIKNYNKSNGLLGDQMNERSILVDDQNRVWAGHTTGLTLYTPATNSSNVHVEVPAPITQITEVNPYLETIDWTDSLNLIYYEALSPWNHLPQNLILPYDKNSLSFAFASSSHTISEKVRYQWRLVPMNKFWVSVTSKTEADYTNLPAGNYTFEVRSMNHLNVWGEVTTYSFKIKAPFWETWWFLTLVGLIILAFLFLAVWARLRVVEMQKKELEHQIDLRTQEVVKQKDEIIAKNEEMEQQSAQLLFVNQKITKKNRNITASITYAKRIQNAMLPLQTLIKESLTESFIFYQPRDIVSGDFYWFFQKDEQIIIAAADCTGHGVPGAFMSLVASNLMHNIIVNKGIMEVDEILDLLDKGIYTYLKQDQTQNRDGMDIAICHIDKKARVLSFAGAKNPLVYLRNGEMKIIKGSRRSVGGFTKVASSSTPFEKHFIKLEEEPTTFYLYSDGFQDQFGGEKGRKFRTVPFRELLDKISTESMGKQKELLLESFQDWKGKQKQVDDVLVIGFKI